MKTNEIESSNIKKWAFISGLSLLIMTIIAPIASFQGVIGNFEHGNPALTMQNLTNNIGLFRASIAIFFAVAFLDILVALCLYQFFKSTSKEVSLFAGWLRLAYSTVLIISAGNLLNALKIMGDGTLTVYLTESQFQFALYNQLQTFLAQWDLGLGLFGIHLFFIGFLSIKSNWVPNIIGILVLIAAAGYLADALGRIIVPNYSIEIAMFTFLGEVVFILWLLFKGIKGFKRK